MPYYRICPLCGAALDPGERCDCQDKIPFAPLTVCRQRSSKTADIRRKSAPKVNNSPFLDTITCEDEARVKREKLTNANILARVRENVRFSLFLQGN